MKNVNKIALSALLSLPFLSIQAQVISPTGVTISTGNNLTMQNLANGISQNIGINATGQVVAMPITGTGTSPWTLNGTVIENNATQSVKTKDLFTIIDPNDADRTFSFKSNGTQSIKTYNDYVTYAGRNMTIHLGNNPTTGQGVNGYGYGIHDKAGQDLFSVDGSSGKVAIGSGYWGTWSTTAPGPYKLYVTGGILTENVKVALKSSAQWADYVFANDYKLMPLGAVKKFIKANNHLPNVLSAEEMVTNGLDVVKTSAKLMEKIEENTLYIIELHEQLQKERAKALLLEARLTKLENK